MSSQRRTSDYWIPFLTFLSDVLAIEGAFLFAYFLRIHTPLIDALGFPHEDLPPVRAYVAGSAFVILAWVLLFSARKMYAARRNVVLVDELINVVRVISFGMLIVMSAGFLYRGFSYSRAVVGLLWVLAILFVTLGRSLILLIERSSYRRGRNLEDAILIGNDSQADLIYTKLHLHPSFGFRMLGYFAAKPAGAEQPLSAAPYLGPLATAAEYISAEGTRRAFIAVGSEDHPELFDLIASCEGLTVEFMMVPDVLELLTSRVSLRELEGIPFLKIKGIPLTAWGRIRKRTFDLVVTMTLLIVLSPLLLILAVVIKLDSRGPILFRQQRVGMDGKEFTMLKFRSMIAEAESLDGSAGLRAASDPARGIGVRNDPRRTRVGRIMRATSLDELPQLLNVLRGEMSLVGPRPERPHFVKELQNVVPKYLDRHRVKTGVTGWAQVNGLRGNTSMAERIKYDLYYVENWSLSFDVRILLRTLRAALSFREASDR
jgi:exopolysaccharide biosynthesis polyprenyl glycosylphosphotransferase